MSDAPKEEIKEEQKPTETTEKEEPEPEEIKPKRVRKTKPIKFEAELLFNPDNGLAALYKKVKDFDPEKFPTKQEALHQLMEKYKRWAYRLYPSEFYDAAWKIASTSGTKTVVRNFIYETNGGEPFIYDDEHPEGVKYFQDKREGEESDGEFKPKGDEQEEKKEEAEQPKDSGKNFIDESSDSDEGDSQSIPEILDLFASQAH